MKYYKDQDGVVFAYEADGSQDAIIPSTHTPMTGAEIKAHLAAAIPSTVDFVPTIISRAQGIMALHNMGLLTTVEAHVDLSDITVQLAWQAVSEFHRDSPMLNALAVELGLDLDAIFTTAATIKL